MGDKRVSLDQFFRCQLHTSVKVFNVEVPVIIRTLSVTEAQDRDNRALAAMRAARRACMDPSSSTYATYVLPLLESAEADRRASVLAFKREILWRESETAVVPVEEQMAKPTTPAEALEQEEIREREQASYMAERERWTQERLEEFAAYYDGLDEEGKRKEVIDLAVNLAISDARLRTYMITTLYYSVRKPDGTPFYRSVEEWEQVSPEFLDALLAAYRELDPASFDPNSSGAQP